MLRVTAYFYECPRGVMDNTEDSGSSAGGSIPSEGAILLFLLYIIIRNTT